MPNYSDPTTKKPDIQYIRALVEEQKEYYSKRDEIDRKLWEHFDDQNPISNAPVAIDIEEVRNGVITEAVNHCKGLFLMERPKVSIPPERLGDRAEERSSALETALNLLPWRLEDEAGAPVWEPTVRDVLLFGHGGFKDLYGPHHWLGYPRRGKDDEKAEDYVKRTDEWKQQNKLPMIWRNIPVNELAGKHEFRACAYPVRGDDGIVEFVTNRTVTLRDLVTRRPDNEEVKGLAASITDGKKKLSTEVELIEWMNKDWIAYVVFYGGMRTESERWRLLEVFPHYLGELPITWIEGDSPHALSIAYPMMDKAQKLDDIVSQVATGHRMYNWPTTYTKVRPESALATGRPPEINIKAGENLTIFTDEDVGFIEHKANSPDTNLLVTLLKGALDRLSPSAGIIEGTTDASGYLFNSRYHVSKTILNVISQRMRVGWEKSIRLKMKISEVVGEPIYLYRQSADKAEEKPGWIELDPKEINGYFNIQGGTEPILPQDLPRNALVARQVTEPNTNGARLMPYGWARENLLAQPDNANIEKQIALEDLKSDPMYKAIYQARVFAEAEEQIEVEEIAAQYAAIGVPPEALPPALLLALQNRRSRGLGGMEVAPGGPNVAAEMAAQQIPGGNVPGNTTPSTTLGQSGFERRQPSRSAG